MVKLDPSRKAVHFYGALDLGSGQENAMMSPVMNGATTALFVQKILLTYPDLPILILWDRAPWHYGAPINELLVANPRLEIMHFPPASPDLNPQEHVWKAARTAISHNHRFARLDSLADAFFNYLTHTRFPSSMLDAYGYNQICPIFT